MQQQWIDEDTTVVEASSGSTAVSEAYFAALLGLPFVAVMPASTSRAKIALIEKHGGRCHFVDHAAEVTAEAHRVAQQTGGHFIDQFTNAERATDWRGNSNIAESIFDQLQNERHPVPSWIVVAPARRDQRHHRAVSSATAATPRLCVVDPENFRRSSRPTPSGGATSTPAPRRASRGIGRPTVEPSFLPSVIDRMEQVPDAASVAAAHQVSAVLGRRVGPSTGTNVWGAFGLLAELAAAGCGGSVVTLICDSGDRYADTYFDDAWLSAQGLDPAPYAQLLADFEQDCSWPVAATVD